VLETQSAFGFTASLRCLLAQIAGGIIAQAKTNYS